MRRAVSYSDKEKIWVSLAAAVLAAGVFHALPWALGWAGEPADLFNFFIPFWNFQKAQLASGHFPLWMPYLNGGQPHAVDPNNMMFYPPHFLDLLFTPSSALTLFFLIHAAWAGLGMQVWVRNSGGGRWAGWVALCFYLGSGFAVVERPHPTVWATYSWMPWCMVTLSRWSQFPGEGRRAFWAGCCATMLFLAGNPQVALVCFYLGLVYALVGFASKPSSEGGHWAGAVRSFPMFVLGVLPALALIVPFWEYAGLSPRRWLSVDYAGFNAVGSVPYSDLPRLVFGFVRSMPLVWDLPSVGTMEASVGTVGIWGPFLALWALCSPSRRTLWVVVALFGVLGVALGLGAHTPIHPFLCDWAPGFSKTRGPFRFLFLWTLSVSFLAGLGAEALVRRISNGEATGLARVAMAAYVILFLALAARLEPFPIWEVCALVAGGTAWICAALGWRRAAWVTGMLALGIPWSVLVMGAPARVPGTLYLYEKFTPFIDSLRNPGAGGRVFLGDQVPYGNDRVLPANVSVALGIRNVGGNNAMMIDRSLETKRVGFDAYQKLWAVQGFLTGNDRGKVPGFTETVEGSARFYRAQRPAPLAYSPGVIRWVPSEEDALIKMRAADFDPHNVSYLKGDGSGAPHESCSLRVQRLSRGPDREEWTIGKPKPGWVVFTEVDFPGWKAWLDGRAVAIRNANSNFRALWLPEGDHQVVFEYRPLWFKALVPLFCLWCVIVVWFWKREAPRAHVRRSP